MNSFKHPIIGQEAIVPTYGLGCVVDFRDDGVDRGIEVRPYEANYTIKFEPENVRLVKINFE